MIARGRIGAVVAGMGFIVPGVILVWIVSFLYDRYGISNNVVVTVLAGIKCAVAASVLYATYNLGRHAFLDHETKMLSNSLLFIGAFGALQGVLNINFFIVLAISGIFNIFFVLQRWVIAAIFGGLCILTFGLYAAYYGVPGNSVVTADGLTDRSRSNLFVIGLLSGLLTFGGAYTVIPFIARTLIKAWLTSRVLLDSVALTICLPAPLVTFVAFIGYNGCGFWCAVLSTIGVFIPAFSFTLIGHALFEKLLTYPVVHSIFDGVTCGTIGLVFITSLQLTRDAVQVPTGAIIFCVSLGILYGFKHRLLGMFVMIAGGLSGYVLFNIGV